MTRFLKHGFLAIALLALAACGGGGGDDDQDVATDGDVTEGGADADADADADSDADADVEPEVTPDIPPDVVPDGDGGPTACGPYPGGGCPTGEVCDIHGCGDGAGGYCVPAPGGDCPTVYAPVCGCDGVTYGNDCERLSAGAARDHDGECPTVPMCGGIAGIPCAPREVCDIVGCYPDAAGTCVRDPGGVCPDRWAPVCGCDGRTYDNDCMRLSAGTALDHVGECGATPAICGGLAGFRCPADQVCDIRDCVPDASGTCVDDPGGRCPEIYAPVCGCDRVTYDNDCMRLSAGAALDHDGECGTTTCVPECRRGTGSLGYWVDSCATTSICTAACTGCTAVCLHDDTRSEGWYAECPTGIDGGCGMSTNLIVWTDCM